MPPQEGMPSVSETEKDRMMHISLPISYETSLMGSDSSKAQDESTVIGNNFSISINTDSKVEADRIFNDLSADGQVTMDMENTFWGSYFGMFTDKFGINWMVSFEENVNQ
jgi:PhnB protein